MNLRDFRIGWRMLAQEPAYSLVAVLGLAVGFAAFLLLAGFVRFSWQYNTHIPEVDQVYVVKQRFNVDGKAPWFDYAPLLLRKAAAEMPGVAGATASVPARPEQAGLTVSVNGQLSQLRGHIVLPGFVETLGVEAAQGSLAGALERPDSLVLTEATAEKLFGTAQTQGRTLKVENQLMRVSAVVRNPPANTTIPFEVLFGANTSLIDGEIRDELHTGSRGWWGRVLIRLRPQASASAIAAALQQAIDQSPVMQNLPPDVKARLGTRKVMDVELAPLRYAYFDHTISGDALASAGERANPAVVAGLGGIALLILTLAAINYVNLASVRTLRRQREIAMRKVLGAGTRQIAIQLLAESLLVALLATLLGLLLAWAALPMFSTLVNRNLVSILSLTNLGLALLTGGLLGLGTAISPAWIARYVRPAKVLAGRPETESMAGARWRKVLTILQVATAMGLAALTLAVLWQTRFAMQAEPGFDPDPLLILDLPNEVVEKDQAHMQALAFASALAAQPAVAGVATSTDAVGRHLSSATLDLKRPDGTGASLDIRHVSVNFFDTYRLKPVSGRLFQPARDKEDDQEPLVLNAIAARALGYSNPAAAVGQALAYTGYDGKVVHKRVIGIAPELRHQSLRSPARPMGYMLQSKGLSLNVRAAARREDAEAAIRMLWPKYFPDAALKLTPARTILESNYADDARMARLLAMSTAMALVLAAFGTYVLSAHTVQRRAREIALRKLHGARPWDIGILVMREIAMLTLVSAALGLPLAAVAIQRYLAGYVEHAPIGATTLAVAFCATLAVALVAVARHARIALRLPPAVVLRAS
jgi:cell division protein FtsX